MGNYAASIIGHQSPYKTNLVYPLYPKHVRQKDYLSFMPLVYYPLYPPCFCGSKLHNK